MVGIVLVSHSSRLALGVAELAREMGGDVRLEAAGGMEPDAAGEEPPLGTDAARVMAAIEAADDGSGDGVLVLMDLGSAVLSAETALDLLDPDLAERVRLAAAPLVEGAVAAAVSAQSGASLEAVAAEARGGLAGKLAHLGEEAPASAPPAAAQEDRKPGDRMGPRSPAPSPGAIEDRFVVTVAQGLHARPAARFVRTATAFDAQIELRNATTGAGPASATSLNAIATLGVREGHELLLRATGPDARTALQKLREVATEGGGDVVAGGTGTSGAGANADEAGADGADGAGDAVDAISPAAPARALPPGAPEGALAGIASSPGIAFGPLLWIGGGAGAATPIAQAPSGPPEQEWAALSAARDLVRGEIERGRDRLARDVGANEAEVLDALALVLDDDALLGPARHAIDDDRRSAARAWSDAVDAIADRYRALDDPYQRERAADVLDVGQRVLRALATEASPPASLDAVAGQDPARHPGAGQSILLAADLTPIDAAGLDRATVAGIATAQGGPTSHGAILARALGVPAVVGIGDGLTQLRDGARAILDGDAGLLIPAPMPATEQDYRERRALAAAAAEQASAAAHDPATTSDGVRIEVAANAGSPFDAEEAAAEGADGVGLLRTEFAFLDRASAPSEDEQVAIYSQAARALNGLPLIVRTLDAGADKPLPYLAMAAEANPFLGVRGVRLGLARPELLRTQLRAIVRTAGAFPNVKLMFPMIATIDELRAARGLLDAALAQTGAQPLDGFEVGIMVEVPAAALTAVQLAREVDFFSLGTNDLTQYVLAAERGNAALGALADGLHPAVLRLVDEVCRAARAHGRWVGVCGELGADPAAAPLLVGLGVRELSVAAPSVPAVKAAIRTLDVGDAEALAHAALAAESADAVRVLVALA
ncbi:phosphoenolpyruvate--protein phosphotransferase [Conexibacter sp. CPCC 206217]|uniref:phosphoenolpyruvate--protein phosphotransferase n=1 Tax=Conexibacter sp. CPCC 206217 TaxID=3064574 RepID=UPI00271B52D3|nr:phosphoenolpyruvate--protein phosphotransferase [Conexibacter sp. CPCC 206217]MDO8213507.1 phosphoenolpyruvate--protein phosphotransferase [Conexibacter sp. CPCC 206217]